jgi:hypothetical protein
MWRVKNSKDFYNLAIYKKKIIITKEIVVKKTWEGKIIQKEENL